MLENQLNNPEMIPQPDYRPDRLADYAFWNRVVSALHWLALLLIALIAWLWRFRSNVILRGLGRRLATLFSWRDWAFVVVTGVLIPMGLYWLVHGTETAVSAQRYNLIYSSMLMPGGQVGSLFLLLVLVPILMVTLRLKKMLPVQVVSLPRMIFLAVILAAVSMPVFGLAGESKDGGIRLTQLGFGLQALAVALVLASPVVALFRRKHEIGSLISKAVRGQLVVGVYMIAAVVVVLQMPIYHALEKHWVAEDEIFKISREHTSFSNMESLVTKHLYMELDELLSEIERDMTRLMPSS